MAKRHQLDHPTRVAQGLRLVPIQQWLQARRGTGEPNTSNGVGQEMATLRTRLPIRRQIPAHP
ncbi:hypothetical protein EMPG_17310 [Blastomyces silverae]|uniref:Uncharacterized protein n=1 Tax=Blastomyces silverae TaxID=2060906 RepID=A0A0H1B718_9EURO|nr:hypothetical protein EMPG_17310 [Blastomyces silverae]